MMNHPSSRTDPDLLHTDLLEKSYGPVHAEVLRHDDEMREAKIMDQSGCLRTFAITFFNQTQNDPEVNVVNEEIKKGGLMGKTFRAHGFATQRNELGTFPMPIPSILQKEFQTKLTEMPARVVEFMVSKNSKPFTLYGTIIEIGGFSFNPKIENKSIAARWRKRAVKCLPTIS